MNRLGIAMVALIVFFQSVAVLYGREEKALSRVMILPLEVSQQGRYSYLQDSIRQMLISRLVRQGEVEIIDFNQAGSELDKLRAAQGTSGFSEAIAAIGLDWLVDGKLYSMKDGLQVNLTFHPADKAAKQVLYSLKAASPDEVMSAVAQLVTEITEGTFSSSKAEQTTAGAADNNVELDGFRTAHPERDYKKGLYGGAGLFGGDKDERFASKGIRKSSELPIVIETMAFGDLNGDRIDELIVSSRSRIRIFRYEKGTFTEAAEYDFSPNVKIHALNIADLGKTGRNRLYVSANDGKYPASAILTWDGSAELTAELRDIRWYIRPVAIGGKMLLAGQKDSPNVSDRFLAPGVFELYLDPVTAKVVKEAKILLPPKVNLFDFVIADLNGDKNPETVVVDEMQKLLVYDDVLNLIWVSSANYGGSNRYFGPSPAKDDNLDSKAYSEAEGGQRELVYIPGRMDLKDITGDGLPEIVVSSNEVSAISEYLANFRGYDGGSVACLSWRGDGLMELWRTNHIEGYVADYAFDGTGEIVGEGKNLVMNRLFVAQVPDATFWDKFIPGGDNSKIIAYEMQVKKEVNAP